MTFQDDIDSDVRCEKSWLIVSQCAHCRGVELDFDPGDLQL